MGLICTPYGYSGAPKVLGLVAYQSVILADKPVAYWPLNETGGTVANDLSGNGFNGTFEGGVTLASVAFPAGGMAPVFNGSSGYVTGSQLITSATANVALEAWVNFQGVSTPPGSCFLKNGTYQNGYSFGNSNGTYDNSGNYFLGLYEITSWNPTTSPIGTTGWQHCVNVIGPNSESAFYINGVQVATNSNSNIDGPTGEWVIGADDANSSSANAIARFFSGALCNAAIYNSALTATQIQNHYNAGIA
ncbi:LamG-like jellyroll fold domain-containing protein [Acidithiobacillus albertensis]|uniref:LamG-like jellyroll fold domain-containing protein n=1 Tax=Acidithiobacillus albertensis TaxID=119978 RepID=UPI00094B3BBE|nr:LamG-like jellyroll fold domain-containing protein [Acidithiobacillus albertensis]